MKLRAIAASLTLLVLTQCTPTPKLPPQPAFDVIVSLTPAAAAKVRSFNGSVLIDAYYYGFPKPGVAAEIDEVGRVRLGDESYEIRPPVTKARVVPTDLDVILYAKVVEPYVQISANGYNMGEEGLSCSYFHGSLASAAKTGAAITCDVATGAD